MNSLTGNATSQSTVAPFLKKPSSVDSIKPALATTSDPFITSKTTPSATGGTVRSDTGGITNDRFMNLSSPMPPVYARLYRSSMLKRPTDTATCGFMTCVKFNALNRALVSSGSGNSSAVFVGINVPPARSGTSPKRISTWAFIDRPVHAILLRSLVSMMSNLPPYMYFVVTAPLGSWRSGMSRFGTH